MKREYFEMLWGTYPDGDNGYLPFEKKRMIPPEVWAEWVEKQIVGKPELPAEACLEQYGLNEPGIIRPIEGSDECWVVPQDPESGGRFKSPRHKLERYPINLNVLAHHTASTWGIESAFKAVEPRGWVIGRKDGDTTIVLLYELLDNPIIQALTVKENTGAPNLLIIALGEVTISMSEHKRLMDNGIVFANTREFLNPEGYPNWDVEKGREEMPSLVGTPWDYDRRTETITWDDRPIEVTPSERALLVKMLRCIGSVVLKEDLVAAVNMALERKVNGQFSPSSLKDAISRLKHRLPEEAKTWVKNFSKRGYGIIRP